MKLTIVILGIWAVMCIGPYMCAGAEPADTNIHDLETTVVCDKFEMIGDFDLEFRNTKSYTIQESDQPPNPISFSSLYIDADSISIGDENLDDVKGEIRIDAQPTAQLYIYEKLNTCAQDIYISKITSSDDTTKMTFSSDAEICSLSFGKDSKMCLENIYPDSDEWILMVKGKFRVVEIGKEEGDRPIMENEKISFTGSLEVESPQTCDLDNLRIDFDFKKDIDKITLNSGQTSFISKYDSSPNTFYVKSGDIIYRDVVIEDGFSIDMTKGFYKEPGFLKEFHIENIVEMEVQNITASGQKFSVAFHAKYFGNTYFPKVGVTTQYFLVKENGTIDENNPLVVISNLESKSRNAIEFLIGREYKIEIYVEKLVKDDITIDICDKNFKDEKTFKNIITGFPYSYSTICAYPSEKQPIECYTEAYYWKKDQKEQLPCKTGSFFAKIQSLIVFEIDPLDEDETGGDICGNEEFVVSRRITLNTETSNPVKIYVFFMLEGGFTIASEEPRFTGSLSRGDFLDVKVTVKTPLARFEEENHKIKIYLFYQMEGTDYYTLYFSDPRITDATVIENIIVKMSYGNWLISILGATGIALFAALVAKFLPWKNLEKWIIPSRIMGQGEDVKNLFKLIIIFLSVFIITYVLFMLSS